MATILSIILNEIPGPETWPTWSSVNDGDLFSASTGTVQQPMSVQLSSTTFLLTWRENDNGGTSGGFSLVATVDPSAANKSITFGSTHRWYTEQDSVFPTNNGPADLRVIQLSSTKCLAVYANFAGDDSNKRILRGTVITISGTTVTSGSESVLFTPNDSLARWGSNEMEGLSSTKALLLNSEFSPNTGQNLWVITVSGDSSSLGSRRNMTTQQDNHHVMTKTASNQAVIIYRTGASTTLAQVITQSGTSTSLGASHEIDGTALGTTGESNMNSMDLTEVATDKFLLTTTPAGAEPLGRANDMWGIVLSQSGTTMSSDTWTELTTDDPRTNSTFIVGTVKISDDLAISVHSSGYGLVHETSGTSITSGPGSWVELAPDTISFPTVHNIDVETNVVFGKSSNVYAGKVLSIVLDE